VYRTIRTSRTIIRTLAAICEDKQAKEISVWDKQQFLGNDPQNVYQDNKEQLPEIKEP